MVLDSVAVPAWTAEVVRRLLRDPRVTIKTVSKTGAEPASPAFSLSYRLYHRWDERRYRSKFNPLTIVDLTSELAQIPTVSIDAIDADVAIWLSNCQPQALQGARLTYGILRFIPCDPRREGTDPPYYWELYHHEPVSGSAWELVRTGEQSVIAAEGFSATEIGWSLLQNQATPFAKAGALLERSLYEISRASSTRQFQSSGDGQNGVEAGVCQAAGFSVSARFQLHREEFPAQYPSTYRVPRKRALLVCRVPP